jgi:esterase/lipase superfamily enzyme
MVETGGWRLWMQRFRQTDFFGLPLQYLTLLSLTVLSLLLQGCETPQIRATAPSAIVRVFYATDRNALPDPAANGWFGTERADISYGACYVTIPRDHRMGDIERPSIWELHEDSQKHVLLVKAIPEDKKDFFRRVSAKMKHSPKKRALIFIHGYNVKFEDAALRTAQISYDLGFDGAAVFYSWPSKGTYAGYPRDEAQIDWSEPHLRAFLEDFQKLSGADNVYLISHSMGGRLLTKALMDLNRECLQTNSCAIRGIILAAPNIDAGVFKQNIAPIICSASNVTLYASSKDLALLASMQFHGGYISAGDVRGGEVVIASGMETIDATAVDTSLLGHSYFAERRSVIADIFSQPSHN